MSAYQDAIRDAMAVCDDFIAEYFPLYRKAEDKAPWDKQLFLGAYKTAENIKEAIKKLEPEEK